MTVLPFQRTRVPRALTAADLDRALGLYRELHALLLRASRLPLDDIERFRLSLRYNEVRADLSALFACYMRTTA